MACWGPDAPTARDYGQEMTDTLGAQVALAPQIYANEQKFRPGYTALDLQTMDTVLNGTDTQRGTLDMLQAAQPQLSAMTAAGNTAQRSADIGDIESMGSRATAALLASNPYQKSLLDKLNAQANAGLDAGSSVDPETMRSIRNSVLGGAGGMGWGMDPAAMAALGMSTGQAGQALRSQRQQQAMSTMQANQSVMGDPFLQILGRSSGSGQMAAGMMDSAKSSAANTGPQLFNAESSYAGNLYGSNQAYDWQYKQATPSTMGKVGMVTDTVGSFIGKVAGGMCWVAREVYGAEDPRWMIFREWLLCSAPNWLRDAYLKHGRTWSGWVRRSPLLKRAVRRLMDVAVSRQLRKEHKCR